MVFSDETVHEAKRTIDDDRALEMRRFIAAGPPKKRKVNLDELAGSGDASLERRSFG